jgi:outer membrane protein
MSDHTLAKQRRKMIRILLVTIASLVLFSAAAVSGTPPPDLPQRPLSLRDCLSIALRNNPQIISSEQGIVSAQAALMLTRSSYYPQLSLSATQGLSTLSVEADVETRNELGLAASLTLWKQGRREAVLAGKSTLEASEHSHAATRQDLMEQTARDYYGVLAAQHLVRVAEAGVESARAHLEEVKARVAVGATAEVDTYTAESDLAQAELDEIDTRASLKLALAQLKQSLGLSQDQVFELAEASFSATETLPLFQEAMQSGVKNRPDLSASRASSQASRYSLVQAELNRGPRPELALAYGLESDDWETRDPTWEAFLGISWSLFNGHASKAEVMAAQANLRRAEASLQQLSNQIGLEVGNALAEAERTQDRLQATSISRKATEARLRAAEGKYRQGVGILLEVTDARVAVTRALANEVQSRYDHQISLVSLQRAMGELTLPQEAAQ